jgi:predicted RNA-binding protein with PUA-like domain
MSRWLIKSEPHVYPFSRLVKDKKTSWTGVRSFEARNNLRAMKKGDLALYYHSNEGKEVVGVARVTNEAHRDPTAPKDEDWVTVNFAPVKALAEPVSLAAIKANAKLENLALVKKPRVSVVPLSEAEFQELLKMGKTTNV